MNRKKNRTFYFIETIDEGGADIIRVGSDYAPLWGQTFTSLSDAVEAVKRRNGQAAEFQDTKNGLVAVYNDNTNDGDNL